MTASDDTPSDLLYLAKARYIDANSLAITDTHLAVTPGPQGDITFVDTIPAGADRIDCAGRFVTHAFAVGHHHVYSALARGMPPPSAPPTTFIEILERIWWNLDKKLDADMIRASALAAGLDAAKSGTTLIIDHHASPNAVEGSLAIIAEALESLGLSHVLCYELSDRDGPESRDAGLRESARHLESHQGLVGLHASFTVSDELLDRASALAAEHDTGVHVHVAEAQSDQQHCQASHACRCVERFARAGVLDNPRTILAHCIHLDDTERDLIAASNAWVAHQVESNLNNAVGVPSARGLEHRVFLGTDGMNGDCLASARAACLAAQSTDAPNPLAVYRRLRRVHEYLSTNGFKGDAPNNLVVLDYDPPTPVTASNWPAHIVYALNRSYIHTVISDGRVIVADRRSSLVDENEIMALAREQATRLWSLL
ncbi:MAG: amidohydrolase family protein [Phycisphaeraceae bacterium]|nr:MAG: amidohydrolase family protein [Phycisphaeraceae bacterium]